jgi:hypothetical protein
MSENRVLRRICGSEREEVAGGCRGQHDEEVRNLYAVRVIRSRRLRWSGHVARM